MQVGRRDKTSYVVGSRLFFFSGNRNGPLHPATVLHDEKRTTDQVFTYS